MTDLEKKVFREVFVGKAVRFDNKEQLDNIKRFYEEFNVGYLGYEYIGILGSKRGLIKLNDNLNAYYLAHIYEKNYTFDELFDLYRLTLRRKKMRKQFLREFKGIGVRVDNKEEQTKVYEIFNKYGFGWLSGSDDKDVDFNNEYKYIKISYFGEGIVKARASVCEVNIGINEFFKKVKEFEREHYYNQLTLPTKIAFRNDTTTLVYDDFKVVRAKASNKDEAIRETGLLVALLKALNVKDYNTIIANAWDTDNELTRHFYLYGVVQQLYVDKKLLSRNQFNKLFEAVGDKKPNVNIGGKIIEVEYK
jgi:hypothetical protein